MSKSTWCLVVNYVEYTTSWPSIWVKKNSAKKTFRLGKIWEETKSVWFQIFHFGKLFQGLFAAAIWIYWQHQNMYPNKSMKKKPVSRTGKEMLHYGILRGFVFGRPPTCGAFAHWNVWIIQTQCGATTSNSLSNSSRVINQQHVSVHGHVHVPCMLLLQGKFLVRSRLAL